MEVGMRHDSVGVRILLRILLLILFQLPGEALAADSFVDDSLVPVLIRISDDEAGSIPGEIAAMPRGDARRSAACAFLEVSGSASP